MTPNVHADDTQLVFGPGIEGVPILLVDDNAQKRFVLKSVLAPLGYDIVEAGSGIEALRCVIAQDFAVILMDIRMPDMDGFETAQLVRERQRSELTPVIFITGFGDEAEANVSAYDAGAADFIYSPVPPQQLRAKVAMFANLYARARHLANQARKVQDTADWLTLVTDAAPIGIFHTDENKNFVYVNPRWIEITGITAEEALGQPWQIIRDRHEASSLKAIETATARRAAEFDADPDRGTDAGGDTQTDAVGERTREGGVGLTSTHRFEITGQGTKSKIVESSARPLSRPGAGGGDPVGWVGTLSDVTDEVVAEAKMAAARDAAIAANLKQVNFAASASHELRTPTTSVLGFIEQVLLSETLSDGDRRYLEIADRNAKRLIALINDLTMVGEVDLGAMRMTLEPVEIVPVVRNVLASLSATAQSADVELLYRGDSDPAPQHPWALVDRVRLEQILTNLVSNALKFTPAGGRVELGVGHHDDLVEIEVVDNGIGIAEVAILSVFDRFYRTPLALEKGIPGSGLGLAIAKRMTEAQGGTMAVRSVLGEGSTFSVALVPALPPGADHAARSGSADERKS